MALDVLRGLTITAMVIVNNPGSWSHIYPPLKHATWHGLTPTDLIFPFFVFMMGISIGLVVHRAGRVQHQRVLLRSIKLFALGIFLFLFFINFQQPQFSWWQDKLLSIRWMGVLQRLALVYLISYYIACYLSNRGILLSFIFFPAVYWCLMLFVPYYDGSGAEYVGQLAYGNHLGAWLDELVLGVNHLYYKSAQPFAFDPEGLLSTLPAVASALSGVLVGRYLTNQNLSYQDKSRHLTLLGFALIGLGYLTEWALAVPVNKQLWTPSFVLISSGWASFILGGLIWLIDIRGYKRWSAPFVVFGVNAIGFFVLSGVFARVLLMIPVAQTNVKGALFEQYFSNLLSPTFGSLVYALCFCSACYVLFHWFYHRRIIFKV